MPTAGHLMAGTEPFSLTSPLGKSSVIGSPTRRPRTTERHIRASRQ